MLHRLEDVRDAVLSSARVPFVGAPISLETEVGCGVDTLMKDLLSDVEDGGFGEVEVVVVEIVTGSPYGDVSVR